MSPRGPLPGQGGYEKMVEEGEKDIENEFCGERNDFTKSTITNVFTGGIRGVFPNGFITPKNTPENTNATDDENTNAKATSSSGASSSGTSGTSSSGTFPKRIARSRSRSPAEKSKEDGFILVHEIQIAVHGLVRRFKYHLNEFDSRLPCQPEAEDLTKMIDEISVEFPEWDKNESQVRQFISDLRKRKGQFSRQCQAYIKRRGIVTNPW